MKTIAENMPREKPPKPEELIERLEEKVPMNLFIILTITITVIVIIIISTSSSYSLSRGGCDERGAGFGGRKNT